jgi:hypothetical protein
MHAVHLCNAGLLQCYRMETGSAAARTIRADRLSDGRPAGRPDAMGGEKSLPCVAGAVSLFRDRDRDLYGAGDSLQLSREGGADAARRARGTHLEAELGRRVVVRSLRSTGEETGFGGIGRAQRDRGRCGRGGRAEPGACEWAHMLG